MELRAPRFGDPISCFTSGFSLGDVILLIMVELLKTICIYTFLMLLLFIVVERLKTICIYTFLMLLLLIANLIIRSRLSITAVLELVDLQVTTHSSRGGKSFEVPSKGLCLSCWKAMSL
jgi:hypothetical protein